MRVCVMYACLYSGTVREKERYEGVTGTSSTASNGEFKNINSQINWMLALHCMCVESQVCVSYLTITDSSTFIDCRVNGEKEEKEGEQREGVTAGSQQQMVSGFLPAELSLSSLFLSALLPHVLSCITCRIMYHLTSASLVMYSIYLIYCLTLN